MAQNILSDEDVGFGKQPEQVLSDEEVGFNSQPETKPEATISESKLQDQPVGIRARSLFDIAKRQGISSAAKAFSDMPWTARFGTAISPLTDPIGLINPDMVSEEIQPATGLPRGIIPRIEKASESSFLDKALPTAEVKPDDSIPMTVGKEAYNLAAGIPKFFTSPQGMFFAEAGAKSPTLVRRLFQGDMIKNLGQGIMSTYQNWDKMTNAQKASAVTDMVGSGAMFGLLSIPDLKTKTTPTTGEQNALQIGKSTSLPLVKTPQDSGSMESRQIVGNGQEGVQAQEQGSAEAQQDLQPGVKTPKGAVPGQPFAANILPEDTPSGAGIPMRGIPAQPIPDVHPAPDIVQKIRGNKIKSPIGLQRVFPGLNLSTAEAEDLLYQAWGKRTWKETVPAVENSTEPQSPVSEPITPPVKPQEAGTAPAAAPEPTPEVISDTRTKLATLAKGMIPVRTVKSASEDPFISGIANRLTQERSAVGEIGEIAPGQGYSAQDLVNRGMKMKPEEVSNHIADLMNKKVGDPVLQAAAVRAEEARLSKKSQDLSRIAEEKPLDTGARLAAEDAFKEITKFHEGPVAKIKTIFHGVGEGLQGEIPVDLSNFNGLREAWLRDNGKAPPPRMESEMKRTARNIKKAVADEREVTDKLGKEIDRLTKGKKSLSPESVRDSIVSRMKDMSCRI